MCIDSQPSKSYWGGGRNGSSAQVGISLIPTAVRRSADSDPNVFKVWTHLKNLTVQPPHQEMEGKWFFKLVVSKWTMKDIAGISMLHFQNIWCEKRYGLLKAAILIQSHSLTALWFLMTVSSKRVATLVPYGQEKDIREAPCSPPAKCPGSPWARWQGKL
jgi:hypothetical protein